MRTVTCDRCGKETDGCCFGGTTAVYNVREEDRGKKYKLDLCPDCSSLARSAVEQVVNNK